MRWSRIGIAAVLAAGLAGAAAAATMSVQLRTADVRQTPSALGALQGSLPYGARVEVGEKRGAWYRVSLPDGTAGWVHQDALSRRAVALAPGDNAPTGASSGEMAMSTKGFNSDVEGAFKKQNPQIDFAPVDRMERIRIAASTIARFLRDGGVTPGGAR